LLNNLSTEQLKKMITESADLYISNIDWKNLTNDEVCEQCWEYFMKYMEYYKIKKYISNFYVLCSYIDEKKFILTILLNFSSLGEINDISIKFIRE
jgi:hypothetical protein